MIGISGNRKVGKSTFATYATQRYGLHMCAFADRLKEMCGHTFGLTPSQMEDPAEKETPFRHAIPFTLQDIHKLHKYITDIPQYAELPLVSFEEGCYKHLSGFFTTPREVLQFVGTDIIRTLVSPDFHINALLHNTRHTPKAHLIVTDCRFPNERAFIKDHGGLLVLIRDPHTPCYKTSFDTHPSEMNMGNPEDYDVVIDNDKLLGLPLFFRKIEEVMDPYMQAFLDDESQYEWK